MTTTPPVPGSSITARAQTAVAGPRKREGGEAFVFGVRDEVAELLTGSPFDVDSYLQAAYREIQKSNLLVQAARESGPTVTGAIMLGATLQLPIGGPLGQFYLTPRSEKRGKGWAQLCVPMIGYRGFFELGYRSGRVSFYDYLIVREGDTFSQGSRSGRGNWYEWEQFAGGEFDDEDETGAKRPLTGVVAIARLVNGDVQHKYMSRTAIERRRPTKWEKSPWNGKDAEAMYVKTPHREMAKYMQLSIATAQAVEADEHIAEWNRVTESITTVHDEDVEGRVYDEDGNASDVDEAPPGADAASPQHQAEGSASESAADGRTAPQPWELPERARAEGREMTEAEYETYSVWQADEAAGR